MYTQSSLTHTNNHNHTYASDQQSHASNHNHTHTITITHASYTQSSPVSSIQPAKNAVYLGVGTALKILLNGHTLSFVFPNILCSNFFPYLLWLLDYCD